MPDRTPYLTDERQPEYHHTIMLGGKLLRRNDECTLERGIGYAAGRYAFQYAEETPQGLCLTFFGPVTRARQRYRQVWARTSGDQMATEAVRVIHRQALHRPRRDQDE